MALKNLLVKVGVSTKGLNAELRRTKNTFRREFGEIQSMVSNTGRNMTMGLTAPLALMATQSVRAFDEQAKAIAQVDAGLRSTGAQVGFTSKQLQQMASDLQNKTIFGDEEILKDATAQLLTFTNISGQQFARTQVAALDLATRLDGDLKSASIQLGKALNDPIANLSALSRSGIQFSAEQKEVIKALAETGQMAEAQTIILDELEKQYGGSAEAAAEAGTGPFKQLQNTIGDISEEFGRLINEMIKPLIPRIKELVASFANLTDEQKKTVLVIAGITAAAGPLMMLAGQLMNIIPLVKLMRTAMLALNTTMLANPLLAVAAGVTALAGVMLTLKANTKTAKDETLEFIQSIAGVDKQQQILQLNQRKRELEEEKAIIERAKRLSEAQAKVGSLGDKFDKQIQTFNAAGYTEQVDGITDAITELNKAIATATYGDGAVITLPTVDTGAGGGAGAGGGGDAARAQEDMVEMTMRQATAIENVGAAATATLQPMQDWTQTVADEQNLTAAQRFNELLYNMEQAALQLAQTIGTQLGGAFADMITGAKKSGEAFKSFARDAIKAALAASQAHIIEAAISTGKMSAGLAMFTIPALIGAGMGIVDAAFGDIAAFAAGGLVTGPVLGLVGEGAGTSRMNPEVIAPLDKLQSMMGGSQVQVTGMLRGADILLTNERAQIDRNRLRSF
jgi:hypothetical protein